MAEQIMVRVVVLLLWLVPVLALLLGVRSFVPAFRSETREDRMRRATLAILAVGVSLVMVLGWVTLRLGEDPLPAESVYDRLLRSVRPDASR
jgi:hypothetical protein